MAKYSEIKRVIPLQSHLITAVGRSQKVEEWECIAEVRGRTGKLRREVVGRLDKENTHENKMAKTAVSVYSPRDSQGLTIVQGRVAGVGLGCQGVVSRCLGGAPYHHYGLARIGNSEVFFVSFSLLSFCFVIIIKYSRAQEGNQASYPHHYPSLLL